MRRARHALALLLTALIACGGPRPSAPPAADFAAFVDRYLDEFARWHPSIAAGNGLHQHDDLLEDFSSKAIAEEAAWYKVERDGLHAMDSTRLTPNQFVDRRILLGIVDGWLLELETARNWTRNPMLYASAISDGVHNLMTMNSGPADARMRRVLTKLARVPDLLRAEQENLQHPPALLVRRGIGMFRGTAAMLRSDLRVAFASAGTPALRDSLAASAEAAARAIDGQVDWLEHELLPRADGPIALGADYVAARYRAEELIDVPLDTLIAIGERQLIREEEAFREAAGRIDPRQSAGSVWGDVQRGHPRRGQVAAAAQRVVDELQAFVIARDLVRLPAAERVVAAPAPAFDLGRASMHASPPLEATPVQSFYYVTDADPSWPPAEQEQWLRQFNGPSLAITSAHEVMPGHFVHSLFMRQTPGKVRRIWIGLNPFPQPSSGQDGWAHYAEYLVIEQGFHSQDPRYIMAQLSESMTRICRLIASIRVHTGAWTIEQAAAFFEEKAHLPAPAARHEAERTAYDPTNGGYFLGKRAILKLRRDYQARLGDRFSLREFHERIMKNGIAPWWAHRYLMLPGDSSAVLE